MRKLLTLCLIQNGDSILLGMKKRGFGEGRWNGFGGKLHEGEALEDAVRREVEEETSLVLSRIDHRGVLEFFLEGDILEVHVYAGLEYAGEPVETEEMRPRWFSLQEIPLESMWPDDRFWIPLFLEGKKFRGKFNFQDKNTIEHYDLQVLEDL